MNLKIYLKLFVTNIKVTIEFSLKTKMSFFCLKSEDMLLYWSLE